MMKSPQVNLEPFLHETFKPGLFLGATPIGNLADISLRVLAALMNADEVWAEDTRNLRKLLNLYQIQRSKESIRACHDHNETEMTAKLQDAFNDEKSVLYVSDAGMPVISDPGYKLVQYAQKHDIYTTILPGASSVPTALSLSGAPTDKFGFFGFVPNKTQKRLNYFEKIKSHHFSAICFESPKRILASLQDARKIFGGKHKVAIARELTKTFEEVIANELDELILNVEDKALKGEIVLVIWPGRAFEFDDATLEALILDQLKTNRLNDAVKVVIAETGLARNYVYERALRLKNSSK